MAFCGKCKQKSSRYDDVLQCSADSCNRIFHSTCAGVTQEAFTQMNKSGTCKTWLCADCQESVPEKSGMEQRIQHVIESQFKALKHDLGELKDSQNFLSAKYEEVCKKLDEVLQYKVKLNKLEDEIKIKNDIIDNLSSRLVQLEQYQRNRNIELRDVHQTENENTENIVLKYAEKIDVKLEKNDIEACHRLPNRIGRKQAIIVQFASRKKRDEFLSKKKTIVTNKDLIGQGNSRTYMGENLSPYYKNLLWKTKQVAREHDYKFVWFWKDRILVKQNETSVTVTINNEKDIQKMIKKE